MSEIMDRLNKINTRLSEDAFLSNKGLSNEVGIHVFAQILIRENILSHMAARTTPKRVAIYHKFPFLLLSLCQSLCKGSLEELCSDGSVSSLCLLPNLPDGKCTYRHYRCKQHSSQHQNQKFPVHSFMHVYCFFLI